MLHFIALHASGWLQGAAVYGVLAYAARTFPVPTNPYAKWLVAVFQFALSNVEKGQQAISAPAPEAAKQ